MNDLRRTLRWTTVLRIARALGLVFSFSLPAAVALAATATPTLSSLAAAKGRYIGAAMAPHYLNESGYHGLATTQFNSLTPENAMKWDAIEPARGTFNWSGADQLVAFAQANNLKVRGHTLVWHSQMPSWLANGNFTPAQMSSIMVDHITVEMTRYKGAIQAWDVVNEVFNEDGSWRNSPWYKAMGRDFVAQAFKAARAADPAARLYINDYNVEGASAKTTALYDLVASLKAAGVPIDGVGLQAHFILGQVPTSLQATMQKFAALGVDVAITELDIRMPMPSDSGKLAQQATDYGNVVKACLAVPRCVGVTTWGITDKYSWVPSVFSGQGAGLLYDGAYNPKPAYNAVIAALGGSITPMPTPAPAPTSVPGGQLMGNGSARCVTAVNNQAADGTRIQLRDCDGSSGQTWNHVNNTLVNGGSSKCLTPDSASDGALVALRTCNGSAAQRWTLSGGEIINTASGKCLDAAGFGTGNGTPLQIYSCSKASNQGWTHTPYGNTIKRYKLIGQASGRCASVVNDASADGSRLQLWDCIGHGGQSWTLAGQALVNGGTGKCLTPDNGAEGALVAIRACDGTPAQQWALRNGEVVHTASGKCLDAAGFGTGNGTRLQIWACSKNGNQAWRYVQ